MRIFAICLIKNEADIIRYNLKQASKWADKIFVLDNGSTDGTWEIVQEMANDIITPWKQDFSRYRDSIRGNLFNYFRHLAKDGDWWCYKLDADEIYADDPRKFLSNVPSKYHVVFSDQIEYYLTKEDIEEYQFENDFEKDCEKVNYYTPTIWSELVFFKYRKRMVWEGDSNMPKHLGPYYQKRIRVQHFKYRSPQQIKTRFATRNQKLDLGNKEWNIDPKEWKKVLKERKNMKKDTKDGQWHYTDCRNTFSYEPQYKHWAKRILFGLGIWR